MQFLRQHTGGSRVSAYVQSTSTYILTFLRPSFLSGSELIYKTCFGSKRTFLLPGPVLQLRSLPRVGHADSGICVADVSFQVSVQPKIPFIESTISSDTSGCGNGPTGKKTRCLLKASSEDRSPNQDRKKISNSNFSSPVRPSTKPPSLAAPDFAFLAVLYLDGRRIPERKIVVYINPADKDFNSPDGKVAFKHRWVQSADGRMTEHAWVFKENAIETVFDKLMIAGSQANVEDHDDDALIKAMESSGLETQGNPEKESKVGQIVVELQRIVLGKKRTEANYRSLHQEGQGEDIDMEGVRREITHATGFWTLPQAYVHSADMFYLRFVHKNAVDTQTLRVVEYCGYISKSMFLTLYNKKCLLLLSICVTQTQGSCLKT